MCVRRGASSRRLGLPMLRALLQIYLRYTCIHSITANQVVINLLNQIFAKKSGLFIDLHMYSFSLFTRSSAIETTPTTRGINFYCKSTVPAHQTSKYALVIWLTKLFLALFIDA